MEPASSRVQIRILAAGHPKRSANHDVETRPSSRSQKAPAPSSKLIAVDALRGLAAFTVMMAHAQ